MKSFLKKIYRYTLRKSKMMKLVDAVFIKREYRREILSCYQAQEKYGYQGLSAEGHKFRLRRNIHRLEKGLIMNPLRDVFAIDYIQDTMVSYGVVTNGNVDSDEIKWFKDVLYQYFAVTGNNSVINGCRSEFTALNSKHAAISDACLSAPSDRASYPKSGIDYESFFKLCRQRRSVRWYEDKPVPRDLVDKALLAASQSPSACNRQPFEFRIFDDPVLTKKVADLPMGTRGFTHQFPMLAVVVGKLEAFQYARDRHLIYIDGSLASMTFMFALESLGLSSCPINWPDIEGLEKKMSNLLELEDFHRPIMLISIGFAEQKGKIPFSHKKGLEELRKYN